MNSESEGVRHYLRARELAGRWGTTIKALAQLRYRGTGPEYVYIKNVGIRYPLDAVERWERESAEATVGA